MRRPVLIGLIWLVGVGCGLGFTALSDSWYEYRVIPGLPPAMQQMIGEGGWDPYRVEHVGSSIVNYLRRPRFLPHSDATPPSSPPTTVPRPPITAPAPTTAPTPVSPTASAIHQMASFLANRIRTFANSTSDRPTYSFSASDYTSTQNMYSQLSAELDVDGGDSQQAQAVRALLPQIKQALDTAKTSNNNDALLRLAVQLEHVS